MSKPPFTMSKYSTITDLHKDRGDYYMSRCRNAEIKLSLLIDLCEEEIADPEDVGYLVLAKKHIEEYSKEKDLLHIDLTKKGE